MALLTLNYDELKLDTWKIKQNLFKIGKLENQKCNFRKFSFKESISAKKFIVNHNVNLSWIKIKYIIVDFFVLYIIKLKLHFTI